MMRISTLAFGITTLASILIAGVFWRKYHIEHLRSSDLSARLHASAIRMELPDPGRMPMPSPHAQMAASIDTAPIGPKTVSSANDRQDAQVNAELRQAVLAQLRLQIPQSYPDLMTELELTPDQLGQLFDLLVKQQEDRGKISNGLSDAGEAERIRTYAEMTERQRAELSALLGNRYYKFEEYKKSQAARQQVATVRTAMESRGTPMRQDQVRLLTQTMISERLRLQEQEKEVTRMAEARQPQPPEQFARNLFDMRAEGDRRVLSAARAYLDEAQLQTLQLQLESRTTINRANFQGPPNSSDMQVTPEPISNASARPF